MLETVAKPPGPLVEKTYFLIIFEYFLNCFTKENFSQNIDMFFWDQQNHRQNLIV